MMTYEEIKEAARKYRSKVSVSKRFIGDIFIGEKIFGTVSEACEEAFKAGALTALTNQNKELEK